MLHSRALLALLHWSFSLIMWAYSWIVNTYLTPKMFFLTHLRNSWTKTSKRKKKSRKTCHKNIADITKAKNANQFSICFDKWQLNGVFCTAKSKDWSLKFRSKHSTVLLLSLPKFNESDVTWCVQFRVNLIVEIKLIPLYSCRPLYPQTLDTNKGINQRNFGAECGRQICFGRN